MFRALLRFVFCTSIQLILRAEFGSKKLRRIEPYKPMFRIKQFKQSRIFLMDGAQKLFKKIKKMVYQQKN